MKKILIILPFFILLTGYSLQSKASKIDKFWYWFSENQIELLNSEIGDDVFIDFIKELHNVHPEIKFLISVQKENGTRELTFTSFGNKNLFPIIEKLVLNAPKYENWIFTSLIQRVQEENIKCLKLSNSYSYPEMFYTYDITKRNKINLTLFIKDYDGSFKYLNSWKFLLNILIGEYDLATEINKIELKALIEAEKNNVYPILNLRTFIDNRKTINK